MPPIQFFFFFFLICWNYMNVTLCFLSFPFSLIDTLNSKQDWSGRDQGRYLSTWKKIKNEKVVLINIYSIMGTQVLHEKIEVWSPHLWRCKLLSYKECRRKCRLGDNLCGYWRYGSSICMQVCTRLLKFAMTFSSS